MTLPRLNEIPLKKGDWFLDIKSEPAYSERVRINPISGTMLRKAQPRGSASILRKTQFGCTASFVLIEQFTVATGAA